jgi:hypothetical protein
MIRGAKIGDRVWLHAFTAGPRHCEIVRLKKKSGHVWATVKMLTSDDKMDEGYEMTVRLGWLTRMAHQLT